MTLSDVVALLGFLLAVAAVGSSGALFPPGRWYETLDKPDWRPPNWAFGPVWMVLYVCIAVAGWRVWSAVGFSGAPLAFAVYALNLVLNFLWSYLFFGLRRMRLALFEMAAMWLTILALIGLFAPVDGIAAGLMVPYLLWVSAAFALNLSLLRRNPGGRPRGAPQEVEA
ncbi:MAG: TspO/MBR family protein [Pseudomonadota bacterium]